MHITILAMVLLATTPLLRAEAPTTQHATGETSIKKVSIDEFETLRAEKDTVVLDVRTPKEFADGHVPGAVNIDWHSRDFEKRVSELDKSKKYLVHCLAGVRSAAATKKMGSLDFLHLYDFGGGWREYEKSGKPVEK